MMIYRNGEMHLGVFWASLWPMISPMVIQVQNFQAESCISNTKQSTTIEHDILKLASCKALMTCFDEGQPVCKIGMLLDAVYRGPWKPRRPSVYRESRRAVLLVLGGGARNW